MALLAGIYVPKKGDKIDFKPDGDNSYYMVATIKDILDNKGAT